MDLTGARGILTKLSSFGVFGSVATVGFELGKDTIIERGMPPTLGNLICSDRGIFVAVGFSSSGEGVAGVVGRCPVALALTVMSLRPSIFRSPRSRYLTDLSFLGAVGAWLLSVLALAVLSSTGGGEGLFVGAVWRTVERAKGCTRIPVGRVATITVLETRASETEALFFNTDVRMTTREGNCFVVAVLSLRSTAVVGLGRLNSEGSLGFSALMVSKRLRVSDLAFLDPTWKELRAGTMKIS